MIRIVLDDPTLAKLGGLGQPTELCDESGRVVGYVTPAVTQSLYATLKSPHSDEELRRREQEQETFSTEEVLRHLERL